MYDTLASTLFDYAQGRHDQLVMALFPLSVEAASELSQDKAPGSYILPVQIHSLPTP